MENTHTAVGQIPGYTYGLVNETPVTLADLDLLKQTILFTAEDERLLNLAGDVLRPQTDAILDVWYGFVGAHPHLLQYFSHGGEPNAAYLAAVRQRFGQWIIDLCQKPYDQQWLAYQYEIARRHHWKKNQTDGVQAEPIIHLRYILAFIVPLTLTIKPFLAAGSHDAATQEGMYNAWLKAVTLTAILWSYPYVRDNQF